MEKMTIWFDMDGTIADLYGVKDWLPMLIAENPAPYELATPMLNMNVLARKLNKIRRAGYKLGIISWLSKNSTTSYDEKVKAAKLAWLKKHLKSVTFDEVNIVAYGTPKYTLGTGILFDDEKPNRDAWTGVAFDATDIMKVLKGLS